MKYTLMFALWLLATASSLRAAELVPRVENESVTIAVRGLAFPEAVRKDLVSGLTNRMLIRVTLKLDGAPIVQSAVDVGVRYDLWEESFRMTMVVDGQSLPARTIPNLAALTDLFADLPVSGLFGTTRLQRGRSYTVEAEVLFDPIDRDRMEKIRQWVARNSAFPGAGAQTSNGSSPSADLFNRIFEQYAAGAEFAAIWRDTIVSKPFEP